MADIDWPTTLPQELLRDGYQEAIPENRITDNFETGPVGRRRRSTATPFSVTGKMLMTTAQWEYLKDFCTNTIVGMSLPFGFPEHGASSPGQWLVRFVESPSRTAINVEGYWEVAMHLEVLP
jgi:hypothetical protein